jgi:hypothetical protein
VFSPLRHPFTRAAALVFGVLAQAVAEAQPAVTGARPEIAAIRIPDGADVRLDGVLDEDVWRTGDAASSFIQRDPDNGARATERTEVRVAYDSAALIIGAVLHDTEPGRVLGNQMQRDESFSADDRFIVTLDTFLDGRSGYVFQTNPAGALSDALVSPSSNSSDQTTRDFGAGLNLSWDGIWTVRVRRFDGGWTLEMEIPFRTLNFDPRLEAWGINFQRTVRRKAEESLWSGYERNSGVAHMPSAGRLTGLTGISQGVGLDVKPYVVGNLSSAPGRDRPGHVSTGDVGVDLFYNLTPALRATLSINTDFAETEVDTRQVNLTRFPLFFEEKRDFFLQGASYFDFAREIGTAVTPFFSRRIGLDEDGIPQPIDLGAKLTGQAGGFDLGFLQVRTAETPDRAGADFTTVRVRRRFLRESYAGVLYTRRADRLPGAPDLHTVGVDFGLRTSTFMGSKTLEWSGWYLNTTNPLDTGQNIGRGSRVAFPNDPFYVDFSYRELQPHYDPAVGFLQRVGFRRYNPEVGYTWRFTELPWIRFIQQEIDLEFVSDMDNRLLTRTAALRPLTVGFNDGSELAYEAEPTYERLDEEFPISDGIILPVGEVYRFTRHQLSASMADQYPFALGGQVAWGDFLSGRRTDFGLNARIRPRAGVALRIEAEHNVLDLDEGSFETTVYRAEANTQFSPWVSLVNSLQYDNVTRLLGWQLRARWIQRPGNDLFFVYTHNWREFDGVDRRGFGTLDNRAAAKIVYTMRF